MIVSSDVTSAGVRTITLEAALDAAQEPGPLSDSEATGSGTVRIVVDGPNITYFSDLTVSGLAASDLLPVAGVSSIHLHNAPAGQNGPVITDIIQDAGGDVDGNAIFPAADTGDGDVFREVVETDTLISIERVFGSEDGDSLLGDDIANILNGVGGDDLLDGHGGDDILAGGLGDDLVFGGAGNDTLRGGVGDDLLQGGGGTDVIDGGAGIDINSFADIGAGVTVQLNADGTGTAEYVGPAGPINESFTGIENITGGFGDDTIIASGAAANTIIGGEGDDSSPAPAEPMCSTAVTASTPTASSTSVQR